MRDPAPVLASSSGFERPLGNLGACDVPGFFADDAIAFNYLNFAIFIFNDPFTTEEADTIFPGVFNCDVIHKNVRIFGPDNFIIELIFKAIEGDYDFRLFDAFHIILDLY